ncbi:hypothetical protein LMG29542_01815 [Paraburkholderia humisilvae]|uniref:Uncharacterized protein n=1 Tax=Paraburkholderia humisilvae TaxID=627669 RepID=A0A6J5DE35_9BURK|nr:hypothetical protein LMG29542_01815 [Paraburkholderia humisilvae]
MTNRIEMRTPRLWHALHEFAGGLIEEARVVGNLDCNRVGRVPGLSSTTAYRYTLSSWEEKARAPLAASVQSIENRVANFLGRRAHTVIVKDKVTGEIVGTPTNNKLPRKFDGSRLMLVYADGWPTFRELTDEDRSRDATHYLYWWQWGILWDKGFPALSRTAYGLGAADPIGDTVDWIIEAARRDPQSLYALVGQEYHWTRSEIFGSNLAGPSPLGLEVLPLHKWARTLRFRLNG